MYVSSNKACKYFNVTSTTLHRWHSAGTIQAQVLPSGHRRYKLPEATPPPPRAQETNPKIVYCRVSSPKQKTDLDRQVQLLSHQFPEHRVITDIGSGLNKKE